MSGTRRDTIIVGMVVFAAFAVITWTIFYLQGYLAQRNMVSYRAGFDQVGLLMTGDNVNVAGVPVGRVKLIALEGRKAVVSFFVDPRVEITDHTVALIDASDVFGEAYLTLQIADGKPLAPGATLPVELAPGLRELIKHGVEVILQTKQLLEQAHLLVARIDSVLGKESSFARTLDNVEVLTANARELSGRFEHYGELLEEIMASLDSAALGFRSVVDDNSSGVQRTVARLDNLSARLDTMLTDLESGRGTLGRLLKDEKLYEDLRQTALEARNLIQEIRDKPEKYIRIKAF